MKVTPIFLFLFFIIFFLQIDTTISVVPVSRVFPTPVSISTGPNLIHIQPDYFKVIIKSEGNEILNRAVKRYEEQFFAYEQKKTNEDLSIIEINTKYHYLSSLTIAISDNSEHLAFNISEKYEIEIISTEELSNIVTLNNDEIEKHEWRAFLHADNCFGAIRGLESFYQLIGIHFKNVHDVKNGLEVIYYINGAPLEIIDYPRFPWRGLLIDTARHYIPIELLLQQIEAMEMAKYNVFHWHITDAQSFPFESHLFPNLTLGAYSGLQIYTHDDVKYVIDFAKDRGIRVIPEFDLPGHCSSWNAGYPGFAITCIDKVKNKVWSLMNPFYEMAYPIIEGVYAEVASLFHDTYFHIGADEIKTFCWTDEIPELLEEHDINESDLRESVLFKLINYAIGYNKIPIAWEECLAADPPKNVIIQAWRNWGKNAYLFALENGYKTILSTNFYLDWLKNFDYYYTANTENLKTAAEYPDLAIGGEACLWGERIDKSNFFTATWPNSAAIAQLLWSIEPTQNTTILESQLSAWRCKALIRGIPSIPLNPGECDDFANIHHIHAVVIENNGNKNQEVDIAVSELESELNGQVIVFNDLEAASINNENIGHVVVLTGSVIHKNETIPNQQLSDQPTKNKPSKSASPIPSVLIIVLIFVVGVSVGLLIQVKQLSNRNRAILIIFLIFCIVLAYLLLVHE